MAKCKAVGRGYGEEVWGGASSWLGTGLLGAGILPEKSPLAYKIYSLLGRWGAPACGL